MPVIKNNEDFIPLFNRIHASPEIVIDVETSGLNPRKNHIVSYVITFGPELGDTYYVPLRHAGGGNIGGVHVPDTVDGWQGDNHLFEHELNKALNGKELIGHNFLFDALFMARHGIVPQKSPLICTQVIQALLDEYMPSYSLDACAKAAGVVWKKGDAMYARLAELFGGEPVKSQMQHFWRTSAEDEIVLDYTLGDGQSTWQLYKHQQKLIEQQELSTVWEVEKRTTKALFNMQHLGVRVDESALSELRDTLHGEVDRLTCKLPTMVSKKGESEEFNVRAKDHLLKYFKEHLGYSDSAFGRTEKGNISFTEEWLSSVPEGKEIIRIRQFSNLINSFVEPLINTHIHKGRVHTWFNQLKGDDFGTVTGRLSSNSPNMQQVPRRNKELGKLFRKVFIPDEGYLWSSNDMSQAEYRLFTAYSNEANLIKAYSEGGDIHTLVSTKLGIDRDVAKRLNLAVLYGAGGPKVAEMLGVPLPEAQRLLADYVQIIPSAKSMRYQMQNVAKSRGYVKTMLGRRARFAGTREFPHKAMSRIIQGSNADYIKLKLAEVNEYFDNEAQGEAQMLLTIHDSLDWQVREDKMHHNTKALEIFGDSNIEQSLLKFDQVEMKVDHKIGRTWAEATYG